ncbi:hypothetical protein [Methylovulum psychrotolerans]|uniref:Uncharacterized protein n=1 Tax=Methylovulum psychrotolerans TaxID=1704499 RepID=A0A1Z4BYU1_9GAMM|nr:hypothetical protein [Methylovulum psychrotolerans]ASF46467.1 hypothetical protein CEK71_10495 [Methylovulum psychrotolerans]
MQKQGQGGNAIAYSNATSTGDYAQSFAYATGGEGKAMPIIESDAIANGGAGTGTQAIALYNTTNSSNGITSHNQLNSTANVDLFHGSGRAAGVSEGHASFSQSMLTTLNAPDKQAYTNATLLPLTADINAVLANHHNVAQAFALHDDQRVFAMGNMELLNTATDGLFHDYESKIEITSSLPVGTKDSILTNNLPPYSTRSIGLLDSIIGTHNFTSPDETLTLMVSTVITHHDLPDVFTNETYTFNDLELAHAFFDDRVFNNFTGALTTFDFSLHTKTAGTGLNFDFLYGIAGNVSTYGLSEIDPINSVPIPSTIWLVGIGFMALFRKLTVRANLIRPKAMP